LKGRRLAGLLFEHFLSAFIAHSQNKSGGTANRKEHHRSAFVVGAGNTHTQEKFDD
jgi:hypothetical protein